MLTSTIYYTMLTRSYSKTLATTATDPTVQRETQYFQANIGKVKSVDDLLKNDKLYTYVMKAFGLSDMSYAKGLIRKVLTGGVANPKSLANTLNDPRYKALATAFNFAANGAQTTSSASVQKTTINDYVEQALETNVGKTSPGAQMALYFQRMAPNITSAYSILGDKTLLNVVETAFGLSSSISFQNIDQQAKTISGLLKISDLQKPAYLQKFIERFTANYDAQHPTSASATPTNALQITSPGISQNLLLSIANLPQGGR
ncbi:conserved hypothetical protein [Methylocella tundrae]|uniref:DUF1217 domain-containing protein n=1 Tax=Methylocella tundrae TaxID=227605 RepID=A0A8B6M661_METTU|nr:DUF1217 domain-containing protein [Methylocella tundrae]VTZ22842.1 conserved hypothetical protein [Methylocella tundrae]VTZ50256.1 conserved hypothetical protein [Methylocella tundrae]